MIPNQIKINNDKEALLASTCIKQVQDGINRVPRFARGERVKLTLTGYKSERGTLTVRAYVRALTLEERERQSMGGVVDVEVALAGLDTAPRHDHQVVDFEVVLVVERGSITPYIYHERLGYGTDYGAMVAHMAEAQRRERLEAEGTYKQDMMLMAWPK